MLSAMVSFSPRPLQLFARAGVDWWTSAQPLDAAMNLSVRLNQRSTEAIPVYSRSYVLRSPRVGQARPDVNSVRARSLISRNR